MTASGTSGHGAELAAFLDLAVARRGGGQVGFRRALGRQPAPAAPPVDGGMLNSVGLQNPGMAAWLAEELPPLAATGATVVASIWGFTADQYTAAARALRDARDHRAAGAAVDAIVAVEANISCPNMEDRRQMFAHSHHGVRQAVAAAVAGARPAPCPCG